MRLRDALLLAGAMAVGATPVMADVTLLNVSYDPTREFYADVNEAFAAHYKAETGEDVTVRMSHGGSGKQARSVIDGLDADVVTLALSPDIDAIAAGTGKMPADWQSRLPNASSPYTSTIVFLVREGNPKGVKDWDDLAKDGIEVITPNPKTSGGARWNYLAAWIYGLQAFDGDEVAVKAFVGHILANCPVLDTGARGATTTFAQRGIGDVLITWENEAYLSLAELGEDQFDIVVPSVSILAEPPVALVDGNVDAHGTRAAAEAYLDYLYTPEAQAMAAKHYFRPSDPAAAAPEDLARFADVKRVKVSEVFGSWADAQKTHFADGGVFDQIYRPGR